MRQIENMQNLTSQSSNPYSNYSYYDIEEIAIENWDDFPILLELHSTALKNRKTPYAKELKAKLEERLKDIVSKYRNKATILKEIQLYLLVEKTDFTMSLNAEIDKRLGIIEPRYFAFPTTETGISVNKSDPSNYRKNTTLLSLMGYKTGRSAHKEGINQNQRRAILDNAYLKDIEKNIFPFVEDVEEYGGKGSSNRLKKISYCMASRIKDEKRSKSKDFSDSIYEREKDLSYIKQMYYDGKYDNRWDFPDTSI